jgi:hypothetical protein
MTISVRPLLLLVALLLPSWAQAETLTLAQDKRPDWVARDGIVMAGSWEPLMFRVRRDGSPGYEPTPQQRADYQREHSPEMVQELKQLGVNFVMMHCNKGGGLKAERESMADAVHFARLCHEAGLRVGVYNFSGAFLWELLFKERPDAKDWVVRDRNGQPVTYGSAVYRYYWNRNHPDAEAYYQQLVRFAVEDIRADLIHFDNYHVGPGWDANSVDRFRRYLGRTFAPEQLAKIGIAELSTALPPAAETTGLLRFAWDDFQCQSLSDSYCAMCRYARSLRPDVLLECNPAGVVSKIHPPVDHGRLLQGGEAFWDEGELPGLHGATLATRIRTYKVARRMDNVAFAYTRTPLEMAEAMAFNLDCLGCICWFEYARMTNYPGSLGKPIVAETAPYVRFFHQRRDLLRGARVVADVAVLRSFPSQVFGPAENAALTNRIEKALIENRGCFQIIYDHQLADLKRYPVLVLAGCVAMSDGQIQQIRRYVDSGGRLCVIGPVATHDQWMNPRKTPGLENLPDGSVVEIPADADVLDAIRPACGGRQSLKIAAKPSAADVPLGLCAELTEQPNRRLLHLVNYRDSGPTGELEATVRLPAQRQVAEVRLANPERAEDLKVPFQQEGDTVRFTVPAVGVYEIAVVTLQ